MVATPSTSLFQQIQDELDPMKAVSKQLDEIALSFQKSQLKRQRAILHTASQTQANQLQPFRDTMNGLSGIKAHHKQVLRGIREDLDFDTYRSIQKLFESIERDTHHTIQESLRPTTLSMATGVGVGVGGIQSHSHAPHAVGESPSVTKPSPTTESVSTPPEVVIDEFPSDSETTRSVSFSWAVDNQKDIYALMVLSLTGGIIVIYSPQEIKLVSPVVGGIVGTVIGILVNEIYLDD